MESKVQNQSPTSASYGESAFSHLVQTPEDPILESTIYLPQPTWVNHPKIFTYTGLSVKTYRYNAPATCGIDFQGLLEDLGSAPSGSIFLLHACAHNPTGLDPSTEQWEQIRQLIRSKAHLPFFDSAYQGIASGSLEADAKSVRLFTAGGGELLVAQSYAENMGLYGEPIGALNVPAELCDQKYIFNSPPIHGAAIVTTILKERDLYNKWTHELAAIAQHTKNMRQELYDALLARGTPGEWNHIIKQIGMFSFRGLNSQQIALTIKEYHIYMTSDGRINMAGLSSKTVPILADAIRAAVTQIA